MKTKAPEGRHLPRLVRQQLGFRHDGVALPPLRGWAAVENGFRGLAPTAKRFCHFVAKANRTSKVKKQAFDPKSSLQIAEVLPI